jgi:hypothetical protein
MPQGREHIVEIMYPVEVSDSPARPLVVCGEIGGVDICVNVNVVLRIQTRMSNGHDHEPDHEAVSAHVSLSPAIELSGCGTYFKAEQWLDDPDNPCDPRASTRARQGFLNKVHEQVEAVFSDRVLESWKDLKGFPKALTVLGAPNKVFRDYVNQKLRELGDRDLLIPHRGRGAAAHGHGTAAPIPQVEPTGHGN